MKKETKDKIIHLTFPVTLFLYVSLGAVLPFLNVTDNSIWYKALPIFLLNILVPVLLGKIKVDAFWIITITYIAIGVISQAFDYPLWHPAWVIFFLLPIIEVFKYDSKKQKRTRIFNFEFKTKDKKDDDIVDV